MPGIKSTYLIWTRRLPPKGKVARVFAWGGRLGSFTVPDQAADMETLEFSGEVKEDSMHRAAAQHLRNKLGVDGILFGGTVKWKGGRRRFTVTEGK